MSNAAENLSLANLVLPVSDGALILPNCCVVEILIANLSSAMSSPVVMGTMTWRDNDIPVVMFEGLLGGQLPDDFQLRQVAVLQGMADTERLPHFAIALSGMPHLKQMRAGDLEELDAPETGLPQAVYSRVRVDGQEMMIPDWDVMESLTLQALFGEGSWSGATLEQGQDATLPPEVDVQEVALGAAASLTSGPKEEESEASEITLDEQAPFAEPNFDANPDNTSGE
jgi:chemosensory pili system protein ChpC